MENDRKFSDVQPQMQEFLRRYSPQGIAREAEQFTLSHTTHGKLEPVLPHEDVNPATLSKVFYTKFFNECELFEKNQKQQLGLPERVNRFCGYFSTWKEYVSNDYYAENTKASIQAADVIINLSLERAWSLASEQYEVMNNKSNSTDYSQNERQEYAKRAELWKKRADISHWGLVRESKRNKPKR